MQKSRSFILPMMKFRRKNLYDEITCSYLGHVGYEGLDTWGKYFYLEYDLVDLDDKDIDELREHPQYKIEFDTEASTVIFVFEVTSEQYENIVKPFLEGKYSEIDKKYVASHFKKHKPNGEVSMNWRILCKDDWDIPGNLQTLQEYWEELIGIPLPPNAEVWSRPEKRDEIYGYDEYLISCQVEHELNAKSQELNIPVSET